MRLVFIYIILSVVIVTTNYELANGVTAALAVANITGNSLDQFSPEVKFQQCQTQGDWYLEVVKPFNSNKILLTNYVFGVKRGYHQDDYYIVYSDSDTVSVTEENGLVIYEGSKFKLEIYPTTDSTRSMVLATFYRFDAKSHKWLKHSYWCDAHRD
jgi:hypothetical protein